MSKFYDELIKARKRMPAEEFERFKLRLCKKRNIVDIPRNADLLLCSQSRERKMFVTKPVRTISGVAVIAVMTRPSRCRHGKCIYCPGGMGSFFGDVPQSYTGREPATLRALRAGFDPYLQVFNRLEQYVITGHVVDKVELIIMGGTFPSLPKGYQEEFVAYCFKALNDFSEEFFSNSKLDIRKFKEFFELPGNFKDAERVSRIQQRALQLKMKPTLKMEQLRNEKAKIRCVGLTIETRPDFGRLKQGNHLLKLGCTRVEVGVQSIYDSVLKKIERGHNVKDTTVSFKELKDLGFKINAHYMLGLPGSSPKKDLEGMKKLFSDDKLRPDMLKIYPCMVFEGTKLYALWKKKRYTPISTLQAARIIARFKEAVPEYVRIMRVQRDIPTKIRVAGVDRTNLRQYIQGFMKKGIKCRCIRCREAGRASESINGVKLRERHYLASGGIEFFISAEKNDVLFGYCRLRFPSEEQRRELRNAAIVRELHTLSPTAEIGRKSRHSFQHRGIGKTLIRAAEKIAGTYYKKKVAVISAVGARQYFRSLGYKRDGPYMSKVLRGI